MLSVNFYSGRGAEYCDQFVCVSVCPRAYLWNHWTDVHEILLCRSPVAVARSFSGGVVIRCVLPVLWMIPGKSLLSMNALLEIDFCSFVNNNNNNNNNNI